MKKFLSLVLALIMTMSLVTVAGAEDFTDAADVTYVEAVDVISALGIVGGYADGSFNPEGTLTRGAAAKIICNILVGVDTASSLVASAAPYADVPVDHTFAGYIAYCAEKGIISGYADGTFRPAATLTGYAFLKMLLGALEYDATIEGYTGTNWAINVAEDAVAKELTAGLVEKFNGNKAITREEACLFALNALTALKVDYANKGQNITIGGVEISTAASNAEDTEDYLYEDNFASLVWDDADADAFGRPATSWEYDKDDIGTYVASPAASYTGTVKGEAIYKDLGKVKVNDLYLIKNGEVTETTNKIEKASKDVFGAAKSIVEVYVFDIEGEKEKDVIVVEIAYEVGEISKVTAVKYDKDGDVKTPASVTLKEGKGSYETTGFEKGDIVLFAKVGTEIKDMFVADSIEGKVASTKSGKLTIDGVSYTNYSDAALGSKGVFYLGVDGSIVKFVGETAAKSSDYALIYNITKSSNKVNADGLAVAVEYTAYVVLDDGTKASYVLTDDLAKEVKADEYTAGDKFVVCYELDDEKLDVATAEDSMDNFNGELGNAKVAGKFFTAETEFVFVNINTKDGKVTTEVKTGYKNLEKQTTDFTAIFDDDNIVSKVFVIGTAAEATSDKTYAVLLDAAATMTKDDDNTYYTYAVAIDGEEDILVLKGSALKGIAAGDVFEYTLKGDYVDSYAKKTLTAGTVDAVIADYIVIDGAAQYLDEDAQVYLAEVEDGVYTLTETTLAEDDAVAYYTVGGTGKDAANIAFVLVTRVEE